MKQCDRKYRGMRVNHQQGRTDDGIVWSPFCYTCIRYPVRARCQRLMPMNREQIPISIVDLCANVRFLKGCFNYEMAYGHALKSFPEIDTHCNNIKQKSNLFIRNFKFWMALILYRNHRIWMKRSIFHDIFKSFNWKKK